MRRKLVMVLAGLLGAYGLLCAGLFAAMLQPPDRFGQIMKRMPGPAFAVLPFEPLWQIARDGSLRVGDLAPDFSLETTDKSQRVKLSSFHGQKPVVLVFGSYT